MEPSSSAAGGPSMEHQEPRQRLERGDAMATRAAAAACGAAKQVLGGERKPMGKK